MMCRAVYARHGVCLHCLPHDHNIPMHLVKSFDFHVMSLALGPGNGIESESCACANRFMNGFRNRLACIIERTQCSQLARGRGTLACMRRLCLWLCLHMAFQPGSRVSTRHEHRLTGAARKKM